LFGKDKEESEKTELADALEGEEKEVERAKSRPRRKKSLRSVQKKAPRRY
jgi:hypothetical protein